MATWVEMSIDACKASRRLRDKHPRSAVSRAYYSVYSAATHELRKDAAIAFGLGRGNPAHGRLLDYIQQSFVHRDFSNDLIDRVKRNIRDLRRDRERADYMPDEPIDEHDAKESLKRAEQVLQELGFPL